jgi:predicted permease
MDNASLRILYVFTDLILPMVLGYYLHQKQLISDQLCNKLIRFNIIFIYTLLAVLSMWVLPLSRSLLWLPAFGVLLVLIPGLISRLTFARKYTNLLDRGAYMMSSLLANLGTLGGLCAFILYGEIGFAYAQLIGAAQNFILLLVCFPLAQYYYTKQTAAVRKTRLRIDFRQIFISWNQLSLLGLIAGLCLNAFEVPRPALLGTFFNSLVHISAWTALLPVGFMIDLQRARKYYTKIMDLLPLRCILLPAIIYELSRLIFADPILLGTMVILGTAPTAINAVITARLFNLNVDLSIAAFLLTTVVFLLLVFPLLFFYVHAGGSF